LGIRTLYQIPDPKLFSLPDTDPELDVLDSVPDPDPELTLTLINITKKLAV
jgi:hypothetical protein